MQLLCLTMDRFSLTHGTERSLVCTCNDCVSMPQTSAIRTSKMAQTHIAPSRHRLNVHYQPSTYPSVSQWSAALGSRTPRIANSSIDSPRKKSIAFSADAKRGGVPRKLSCTKLAFAARPLSTCSASLYWGEIQAHDSAVPCGTPHCVAHD